MADFAANLDRINRIAEQSPGFVWRLQTEAGDATAIRPFEQADMLVNMWFEPMREAFLVLWRIPAGHLPSVDEAIAKLDTLRALGPTAQAFTFRDAFAPPGDSVQADAAAARATG